MLSSDETRAPRSARNGAGRPIAAALATTAIVTLLSYLLPAEHAATGVGLAFLVATYLLALRGGPDDAERHGLSLGGLLDPGPLSAKRLSREAGLALAWVALVSAITFPFFFVGYVLWWEPARSFELLGLSGGFDEALGQILVIALPEEAFYRGYLQTSLDEAWPPHWRIFGARVGRGILFASILFALGHVATEPNPNRLAVFFPSLLFGWLRARTGGIGASLGYHAACNIFASLLARGYGFSL